MIILSKRYYFDIILRTAYIFDLHLNIINIMNIFSQQHSLLCRQKAAFYLKLFMKPKIIPFASFASPNRVLQRSRFHHIVYDPLKSIINRASKFSPEFKHLINEKRHE